MSVLKPARPKHAKSPSTSFYIKSFNLIELDDLKAMAGLLDIKTSLKLDFLSQNQIKKVSTYVASIGPDFVVF